MVFLVILTCLYYFFEQNDFIIAVEVFRPALIFISIANLIGICCAVRTTTMVGLEVNGKFS